MNDYVNMIDTGFLFSIVQVEIHRNKNTHLIKFEPPLQPLAWVGASLVKGSLHDTVIPDNSEKIKYF